MTRYRIPVYSIYPVYVCVGQLDRIIGQSQLVASSAAAYENGVWIFVADALSFLRSSSSVPPSFSAFFPPLSSPPSPSSSSSPPPPPEYPRGLCSARSAMSSYDPTLIATDEIDGIWPFLQSIDWRDPWLAVLLTFHIAITITALMTRNHANFQIILFLVLLLLVYFSENINEVAATNWMIFSRQQYFDSKGLFISIVFSVPILINCMIMVASWLYQSSELMTNLKQAQLRQAHAQNRQLKAEATNGRIKRPKHE